MKTIGIEALLAWAYRQELPKAAEGSGGGGPGVGTSWGMVAEFAELMTMIDRTNAWGCAPDLTSDAPPHGDAVIVGEAVAALAGGAFTPPEDYDLLGDLADLKDAEKADCHRRGLQRAQISGRDLAVAVARVAMLGRAPQWESHGAPRRRPVLGVKGKPRYFRRIAAPDGNGTIEVDGYDHVRRRPMPFSYQNYRLDPDPALLVAERAEYQAWVIALGVVAADLDGRLADHKVAAPDLPLWPWEDHAAPLRQKAVLFDVSVESSIERTAGRLTCDLN